MAGRHRFSAEQDYVEVVVKQLKASTKKDIDRDIITKTQEALRVLRTKAHPRSLGTFDNETHRAAILLDFVVRKEKNARLCQKSMLKELGLTSKKAQYTKLNDIIGNYLTEASVVPGKASKKSAQGSSSMTLQGSSAADPPAEDDYNNIPRLAIRLSSLIQDPHGFAVQAEKLFRDIQRFVLTLEMPRRADQLNDIQRFRACYGAACLFHLVAQTQTKKLSRQMQRKQQTASKNHLDEDQNCPLEVDDILKACPHFSPRDFKEVCKHVEKLANEMEKAQFMDAPSKETTADDPTALKDTTKSHKKGAKKGAHKGQKGRKRTSSAKEPSISNQSKKKRTASSTSTTNSADTNDNNSTARSDDCDDDENFRRSRTNAIEIPSVFEWREQVLAEACNAARIDLESQGESSDNLTKSGLLAAAADKVLQRFGLAAS